MKPTPPYLTEQIDGIEWAKYNSSAYKWNNSDKLDNFFIYVDRNDGDVLIRHPAQTVDVPYFLRTHLPIPSYNLEGIEKTTIAFYFEMEIIEYLSYHVLLDHGYGIGFCESNYSKLNNTLGIPSNSNAIGMYGKDAMWIDGTKIGLKSKESYKAGDFVGLGVIHYPKSKMECFATFNGQLLGKGTLPTKFTSIQLFPSISLRFEGESIRTNFEREKWKFKQFQSVLP